MPSNQSLLSPVPPSNSLATPTPHPQVQPPLTSHVTQTILPTPTCSSRDHLRQLKFGGGFTHGTGQTGLVAPHGSGSPDEKGKDSERVNTEREGVGAGQSGGRVGVARRGGGRVKSNSEQAQLLRRAQVPINAHVHIQSHALQQPTQQKQFTKAIANTIKGTSSTTANATIELRTIIGQRPTSLYCSELCECLSFESSLALNANSSGCKASNVIFALTSGCNPRGLGFVHQTHHAHRTEGYGSSVTSDTTITRSRYLVKKARERDFERELQRIRENDKQRVSLEHAAMEALSKGRKETGTQEAMMGNSCIRRGGFGRLHPRKLDGGEGEDETMNRNPYHRLQSLSPEHLYTKEDIELLPYSSRAPVLDAGGGNGRVGSGTIDVATASGTSETSENAGTWCDESNANGESGVEKSMTRSIGREEQIHQLPLQLLTPLPTAEHRECRGTNELHQYASKSTLPNTIHCYSHEYAGSALISVSTLRPSSVGEKQKIKPHSQNLARMQIIQRPIWSSFTSLASLIHLGRTTVSGLGRLGGTLSSLVSAQGLALALALENRYGEEALPTSNETQGQAKSRSSSTPATGTQTHNQFQNHQTPSDFRCPKPRTPSPTPSSGARLMQRCACSLTALPTFGMSLENSGLADLSSANAGVNVRAGELDVDRESERKVRRQTRDHEREGSEYGIMTSSASTRALSGVLSKSLSPSPSGSAFDLRSPRRLHQRQRQAICHVRTGMTKSRTDLSSNSTTNSTLSSVSGPSTCSAHSANSASMIVSYFSPGLENKVVLPSALVELGSESNMKATMNSYKFGTAGILRPQRSLSYSTLEDTKTRQDRGGTEKLISSSCFESSYCRKSGDRRQRLSTFFNDSGLTLVEEVDIDDGSCDQSALGSVQEDEVSDDDSEEGYGDDDQKSRDMRIARGIPRNGRRTDGRSVAESRRMRMETTNWSYPDAFIYDAAPRPSVPRKKTERVFIPDFPSRKSKLLESQRDDRLTQPNLHEYPISINVTQLTKTRSSGVAPRDEIISRTEKEIRRWKGSWEVGRRYFLFPDLVECGEREVGWGACANVRLGGFEITKNDEEQQEFTGWWVELLVEEIVKEERKRLFVWSKTSP